VPGQRLSDRDDGVEFGEFDVNATVIALPDDEHDSHEIRQNSNLYHRSAFIPPNAAQFPSL